MASDPQSTGATIATNSYSSKKGRPVKFVCNREVLADALAVASRALSSRGSLTGLKWRVASDTLEIEGRESDLSIRASLPVEGPPMSFTTPAGLAVDMMRSLAGDEVEIVVEESSVYFRSGRAEVALNLLVDFELPPLGQEDVVPVTVPAEELALGIRQVAIAGSRDETRDLVYSGMLFAASPNGLRLVATDGIRLALRDIEGINVMSDQSSGEVVIPTRAVRELERIISSVGSETLTVGIGSKEAIFGAGNVQLATRLIEEPFRDYRRLTDVSYSRVLFADKAQMLSALKALRRMAKEARNSSMLRMSITGTSVEMSVRIPQIGQAYEVIDANFSDDEFVIAFDPDLLADGVEAVQGDTVRLEFIEANRAACITSSDSRSYLYLVMPIVTK
jgi:DNA polymerase-3 subunit beta